MQIAHDSPGMYDASAQRFHLSQRPREIIYREVWQGEEVPRTTSARVDPNRRNGGPRLPALTLSFGAALQGSAEQIAPKTQRTLGFVGREIDQGQRQPLHAHNITPDGRGASMPGTAAEGGLAGGVSALRDSVGTAAQPVGGRPLSVTPDACSQVCAGTRSTSARLSHSSRSQRQLRTAARLKRAGVRRRARRVTCRSTARTRQMPPAKPRGERQPQTAESVRADSNPSGRTLDPYPAHAEGCSCPGPRSPDDPSPALGWG